MRAFICWVVILFGAAATTPFALAQNNWRAQTNPSITDDIWCVTYAQNTFAAVTAQGTLLTSVDGISWSRQTIDSGVWLVSIAYGNGLWVVVGDKGTITTSPDLKTWTTQTSPTTNKLNGVLYNGTIWVAVGESGTIVTSPDAKIWTLQSAISGVTGFLHGLTYVSASSDFSPTGTIYISGANGTLIEGTGSTNTNYTFSRIYFDYTLGASWTSADLEAVVFNPAYVSQASSGSLDLVEVGADGSIEIVAPSGARLTPTSFVVASAVPADVTEVTFQPQYLATPKIDFRGLTYGFGYWVAAGEQGTIFSSHDGSTWQQSNAGSTATLLSAAYSSKLQRIVITGIGGTILAADAPPPSITQQPTSQSASINGSASFSVIADGAATLTYQWFKNGSPISGATSTTLNLTNIQDSDAASYTVVVANEVGIATSSAATLTVLDIPVIQGVPATAPASIGLPFQLGLTLIDGPSTVTVTGLPPGITFNPATNIISGIPTTSGAYSVGISASNSFGNATPVMLSITVGPQPLVFIPIAGGKVGSSDGIGMAAAFNSPNGLAIDAQGNLYVADTGNFTIRKVSASGVVTTIAGTAGMKGTSNGKGAAALFSSPTGIAVDGSGNLYVTDTGNDTIRKIDAAGQSSTIAGTPGMAGSNDSTGSAASFNGPTGIAVDPSGNLYVADSGNDTIRKISSAAAVTTLAGLPGQSGNVDAFGIGARFNGPTGLTLDSAGNLYVNDTGNYSGRMISPTGSVTTVIFPHPQSGPIGSYYPSPPTFEGISIDSAGDIYADQGPVVSFEGLEVDATLSNLFEVSSSGTTSFLQQWTGGGNLVGGVPAPPVAGLVRDNAGNIFILVNGILEESSPASGPVISGQPSSQSVGAGQTVTFSVTASGNPLPSYQWFFNGLTISGATFSTLTLPNVSAAQAGSYSVSVSTPYTSVTSSAANLTVTAPTARLINISTRAMVGTGSNILIPGFVVSGSGTETLLIRADGPSLSQFGVTGVLAKPSLSVYNSSGAVIATNTGWGTSANPTQIASVAASVGAFALSSGSADSAVVMTLPAGAYTVEVSGVGNTTGVALAEIYEVSSTGTRLVNVSTRTQVGTGGNILIPGFVIGGSGTEELLVRADGPSLTQFNVTGVLAQPVLSVLSGQNVVGSNTGWTTGTNPSQITSIGATVGAFSLASGSADSAVVVNLPAGAYTAQVAGVNSTTGVALAEVYEVP